VVDPDVCIALDVGIADDVPGVKNEEKMGKLGGGPQITVADHGMIPNTRLRNLAIDIAKKKKIPVQFQLLMGGATDGGAVHLHHAGVPTLYLGVPTRYIHSHSGIIHADDYDHTLELLLELIRRLDAKTVRGLAP
jgi:endoglucanase